MFSTSNVEIYIFKNFTTRNQTRPWSARLWKITAAADCWDLGRTDLIWHTCDNPRICDEATARHRGGRELRSAGPYGHRTRRQKLLRRPPICPPQTLNGVRYSRRKAWTVATELPSTATPHLLMGCLVPKKINSSHRIVGHIYGVLNTVEKK